MFKLFRLRVLKSEGRTPYKDEKPLQAVLFNQLALLLKDTAILRAREPEAFDAKKEDCRLLIALGNGNAAIIPIEIKQSMHSHLWEAPKTQLVDKYMGEERVRFGLYLVGWYGAEQKMHGIRLHPGANKSPEDLQLALQTHVDNALANTGKRVKVFVYDCSVEASG